MHEVRSKGRIGWVADGWQEELAMHVAATEPPERLRVKGRKVAVFELNRAQRRRIEASLRR